MPEKSSWSSIGRSWISKVPFGRLPGDINIMRARFGFHFPLMACMLISLVMTVVAIQRELSRTLACVRRRHIMPCYRRIASDCFIQSDWSCHVVEPCFWLLIERNLRYFHSAQHV
ncbi:MAG TPA: DUF2905 domain-containing protein [Burkholderiaceae bacterium]|nr:DUF2905 domain-containing protein [Burkholderiaceae bacterium]